MSLTIQDKSESSEEFVIEGDTDVEDDSEETKNLFAAPTLACDVEDALSEVWLASLLRTKTLLFVACLGRLTLSDHFSII